MLKGRPGGGSDVTGAADEVRRGRNVGLDILRGLAALIVVARHSYGLGGHVIAFDDRNLKDLLIAQGATGVWLFFVLSGYLVAKPFVTTVLDGTMPDLRDYARKRLARIFPAFWLALAALLLFAGLAATTPKRTILANLLLLHNLVPGDQRGLLWVSWTLTLEMCFYLFLPVVAAVVVYWRRGRITPRQLGLGVVLLWGASATWAAGFAFLHQDQTGLWLRQVFPATICCFCPGILLAVAERGDLVSAKARARIERALGNRWFVIIAILVLGTLGAYGATVVSVLPLSVASIQCWALAYGVLVAYALRRPVRSRNIAVRAAAWLGLISYGVYLWHSVLIQIFIHYKSGVPLSARWIGVGVNAMPVQSHPGALSDIAQFLYLTALTVAIATISWYLMEAPLIAWSRRRRPAARPVIEAPA